MLVMLKHVYLSICLLRLVSGEVLVGNCVTDEHNYYVEYPVILDKKESCNFYTDFLEGLSINTIPIPKSRVIYNANKFCITENIIECYSRYYRLMTMEY